MMHGGCQCGAVRYEIAGELPETVFVCHCRECQKQSASAFGISVPVGRDTFRLIQGSLSHWHRPADSGATIDCAFCPECGSRVWHCSSNAPQMLRVRGGTFDTPPGISQAVHIWTSRKLDGVAIPAAARQFPGQPE
jgi:hypothetical protein